MISSWFSKKAIKLVKELKARAIARQIKKRACEMGEFDNRTPTLYSSKCKNSTLTYPVS